jgi:hypothetical protein
VIRDQSKKGARLLLPPNAQAPDLILFRDDEDGVFVKAEVRWRKNREIGIRKWR